MAAVIDPTIRSDRAPPGSPLIEALTKRMAAGGRRPSSRAPPTRLPQAEEGSASGR